MYNVKAIRKQFPILRRRFFDRPFVFLDSASTTLKPAPVIDRMTQFYSTCGVNVSRGHYWMAEQATQAFEAARVRVQTWLNAGSPEQIIFTRGATEAVNLVAGGLGRPFFGVGDEVLVTGMEHHSNWVPWQMICREKGCQLRVVPVDETGVLDLEALESLVGPRTRLVAVTHVSNALGTVNPVRRIVEIAHGWNIPVLVDGAQSAGHLPVDVAEMGCDFFVFSAHKVFGPTGIGVLYGRTELLERMAPVQGGGEMVAEVNEERFLLKPLPHKFEAGTPAVAQAIGLGAALDWLLAIDPAERMRHEAGLARLAMDRLSAVPGVRLLGPRGDRAPIVSFTVGALHPHDVATVLDREGVAVRVGHHCCQPLMERLGLPGGTVRASLAAYSTADEIEALGRAVEKALAVLS